MPFQPFQGCMGSHALALPTAAALASAPVHFNPMWPVFNKQEWPIDCRIEPFCLAARIVVQSLRRHQAKHLARVDLHSENSLEISTLRDGSPLQSVYTSYLKKPPNHFLFQDSRSLISK